MYRTVQYLACLDTSAGSRAGSRGRCCAHERGVGSADAAGRAIHAQKTQMTAPRVAGCAVCKGGARYRVPHGIARRQWRGKHGRRAWSFMVAHDVVRAGGREGRPAGAVDHLRLFTTG